MKRSKGGKISVGINFAVDAETDETLETWSEESGRSKRRHVAILVRKLAKLRKSNPTALQQIGLLEPVGVMG